MPSVKITKHRMGSIWLADTRTEAVFGSKNSDFKNIFKVVDSTLSFKWIEIFYVERHL